MGKRDNLKRKRTKIKQERMRRSKNDTTHLDEYRHANKNTNSQVLPLRKNFWPKSFLCEFTRIIWMCVYYFSLLLLSSWSCLYAFNSLKIKPKPNTLCPVRIIYHPINSYKSLKTTTGFKHSEQI